MESFIEPDNANKSLGTFKLINKNNTMWHECNM